MGSIYRRKRKLWARYKDEEGGWVGAATPFHVGEETKAKRYLRELEAGIAARQKVGGDLGLLPGEAITVRRFAARWTADRRALGIRSADDEATRMRHAMSAIGDLKMEEVRPRHIRDLVLDLRKKNTLAPRTIRHVYATGPTASGFVLVI